MVRVGWRSWNLFGDNVNQPLIESQMDGLVSRTRKVNGEFKSLLDLGYNDIGLDDAWQLCGHYGPNKYTYHDELGNPIVDTNVFPDFNKMTDYAHSLGLTAGWYANNCICNDHCVTDECYAGDVKALVNFGFDSVKLDACGKELDLQKWNDLIDATGRSILIENCHWGQTIPTADWCPWHYYRTSGDVRASYDSVVQNLMTTVPFAQQNLSTPGCWAYPDMLEVGCSHGPGGINDPGLSYKEARTHFGAWCIVSSPLILSHDTTNSTITDEIWDIITNTEAIAVNQAWYGESGTLFKESDTKIILNTPLDTKKRSFAVQAVQVGTWQQWSKRINAQDTAVLIMNNDVNSQTIALNFADIPKLPAATSYTVRSIWDKASVDGIKDQLSVVLESHDSYFMVISAN